MVEEHHGKFKFPLAALLKLRYFAIALVMCFAVTLATFPPFTSSISSVRQGSSRFYDPDVFIPFSFLIWNISDTVGRLITAYPKLRPLSRPRLLMAISFLRLLFAPLYLFCNISNRGAIIHSDVFYLLLQSAVGITNGWLGACCMMAASSSPLLDEEERPMAGGAMGLMLSVGLALGSMMSFASVGVIG